MAKDSLAPRGRAANVSRRALLGGIAAAPFASPIGIDADPFAWERAVHAHAAALHAYEVYLATVLRPAYRQFDADLARAPQNALEKKELAGLREVDKAVRDAERQIADSGGDRVAVLALRATNSSHANARKLLARELSLRRMRGRLMRRHRIYEKEDRGNDLASGMSQTLLELIAIPSPNREGALLKMRLAYQDILRPQDHDGVVRMIFADVERLWH
jgi:hypothetical protein